MADVRRLPTPVTEIWDWQIRGACRDHALACASPTGCGAARRSPNAACDSAPTPSSSAATPVTHDLRLSEVAREIVDTDLAADVPPVRGAETRDPGPAARGERS